MTPEHLRAALQKYIPADAIDDCVEWISQHRISVRIKRSRQSKYGDYHPPSNGQNHKITINNDLNPYAFLITFTHEVAHLICFNRFGHHAAPHGIEWKREFKNLLIPFLYKNIFPDDIKSAVIGYLKNPAASSCSDLPLQKALSQYNLKEKGWVHLEELNEGTLFKIRNGKAFIKGRKLQKNFECLEVLKKNKYFINPLMEVAAIDDEEEPR